MNGASLFAEQLSKLGFQCTVDGDWIEFDYLVDGGTYADVSVRMALQVPAGFPGVPPGGIDFKPRLRPVNTGANHPERSHESRKFGKEGEYWSRPHKGWNKEPQKDAKAYMAWVRNLWFTT